MSASSAIVRRVEIAAPAEDVFRLLVEPESLVRWWPDVASLEPREGGAVRFEFGGGESVVHGEVTRFEPPRALSLAWRPSAAPDVVTRIELSVTPLAAARCRVEVVHSGWEAAPELRPLHDAGWTHFLGCLAAVAEGRPFDKSFPKEDP